MNWHLGPGHQGDAIWAMTAMRRIDGTHVFYCPERYHRNLIDICEDRDITLMTDVNVPADAKCVWIGNQRFSHAGVNWRGQEDIIGFLTQWSGQMSIEAGSPRIFSRFDMLADWHAINHPVNDVPEFDALVINCQPQSGQVPRFNNAELEALIGIIAKKHRTVCTNPTVNSDVTVIDKTVSEIGSLANRAQFVVAIASGGSWGIHNVFNRTVPIYLLLDPIKLDYGDRQYPTHGLVTQGLQPQLQNDGWI